MTTNTRRQAIFHHLIKTHKPGPQLRIRPIVANKGSPTEDSVAPQQDPEPLAEGRVLTRTQLRLADGGDR